MKTEIDIAHIAKLSQLEFTNYELSKIYKDMEDIVQMIDELPATNMDMLIDNISKNTANEIMNLSTDEFIEDSFTREEILQNAPCIYNGLVSVPKTV